MRILVAGTLLAGLALSQERTGSLGGIVTDPSGSGIPGASVEVTSPALLQTLKLSTDAGGSYLFASLPPGSYVLSVTAAGFTNFKRADIAIPVGRTIRVDVKLEVGQVTESVVVSGEAVAIDTATTVVSTNVSADIYDRLPKGRSFDSLVALAPGVRAEPKSGGFSVDGASSSENSFVIDGVEVTDIQDGSLNRQNKVPIEWIAETQIKSSGVDAQYGGALGGVVNAITRSGSNQFHGQGSLYLENSSMDAGPRPLLRLNPEDPDQLKAEYFPMSRDDRNFLNPGFRLGGPVMKDKLWFFLSAYPQFDNSKRTVTFVSNKQTGTYERKDRQDFTMARLDYQPFTKLRLNMAYYYNPYRVNGILPGRQGTDSFATPFADSGFRRPATGYNYQGDYTFSSKFSVSVFGGYNYNNYKDYGVPSGTRYRFNNSNAGLAGVPANLVGAAGNFTPDNRQTFKDIYTRNNLNIIGSYLANMGGQHNLRFGYQLNRLANQAIADGWNDGYVFIYWDRTRNAITKPGSFRGPFGYYINRVFLTQGDVSSNNQSLFFQDNWRVSRKLTLNLGLRTEREYVPSFSTDTSIPSKAIEFGFGKKLAPRLGFAYDLTGQGKSKLSGSWGLYYDIMKYEMPRGSFGGDVWVDYYYTLDDPNFLNIKPTSGNPAKGTFPGTFIEAVNNRIPSNDPSDNLIEPDLKPVRLQAYDFGFEQQLTNNYVFGVRYTHKQIDRSIEDVGILTSEGEKYFIANPGSGVTVDPKNWPAGYPNPVTPKPQRDYDAVELRLERRFASNLFFMTSYTWSRLYGNYAGLASSDEAANTVDGGRAGSYNVVPSGRQSPNVNRNYDLPWMSYDAQGKLVYGNLATDRPHTLKFFGSYDLKSKMGVTRFGPQFFAFSGTPVTTEVHVSNVPVFVNGRGDMGRTPVFTQTDLLLSHEFSTPGMREGMKIRLELNVQNLFNHAKATDIFKQYDHDGYGWIAFDDTAQIFKGYDWRKLLVEQDGIKDPRYGLPQAYQTPRTLRLGFHFFF